ncbi:MAG TPA: PDDEXK nuclease domain-containing protein [Thermoplasmata archaeon]|nr:PDDEXK nuclease domain-containing protein [Thermoplasmata archaeon]
MSREMQPSRSEYARFLAEITRRVATAHLRAAVTVNEKLLDLHWQIGKAIVDRQENAGWGDEVILRLAEDLKREFPGTRGFSRSNLFSMRQWYLAYRDSGISPTAIGQIPWGHNLLILNRIEDLEQRLWYVQETVRNGWSRSVLGHQIETDLYRRQAAATKDCNFARVLPRPQSDLAQELLKDPYQFDFLGLGTKIRERDLERALIDHLREFLIELGVGFAYVGSQYRLEVARKEYFIDLVFYHLRLRSLVAIDLKMEESRPGDAGQMSFYLSALDDLVKSPEDRPSIGIILCKSKDRTTVEYSLRDTSKPIGVSAYRLTNALPRELQESLPTLEQLERELERPS